MDEQISEINGILTKEEIEDESNNTLFDSPKTITTQNLSSIQSLIKNLDNYSIKHIIIKNDIECFYSQINNCSIKERLVLDTLLTISQAEKNVKKHKILTYHDIFPKNNSDNNSEQNTDEININSNEEDFNIDNKIFVAVDRVTHKTLHKNILVEGKKVKICSIYKDLNQIEFKERENIGYSNIDKLINNIKEKENHKHLEFIAIKAIILGVINLTEELINNYMKNSHEVNLNYKIINQDDYFLIEEEEEDENNIIVFKPLLFEVIFNDFVFTSNMCPFLENYFIESFNRFREKYQLSFTLSELFSDIFWNRIFHNKILCSKFISIYIGNDDCPENIRITLSKIIKIISDVSIPLKSQICQLLSLSHIDNKEIDLMSSIVIQKNINHDLIKNENLLNIVNKNKLNMNMNLNLNEKNDSNKKENSNNNKNNSSKKKESNKNSKDNGEVVLDEDDLEHKTVDEVYNYINDNKEKKTKKKKRTKKKKEKKIENEIKAFNDSNINNTINIIDDDFIVNQFKQDIEQEIIDANEIHKVKPLISESWIQMISNY